MATKKKTTETFNAPPKMITSETFYGMKLDEEQLVLANAIWSPDYDIVFCNAKSGCGKTTVAVGIANLLVQYGLYDNIVYIMSPYGEKRQGWLPGTITEKSSVYFEAFYQALLNCNVNPNTAINTESMVNQKNGTGYISCITDTFLRGTNLDKTVAVIDEAQNYTVAQLKKVLTRMGTQTKVIVIGHDQQCDLDRVSDSGFKKYLDHFAGKERSAICELTTNHRGWISSWADELQEDL